MFLKHLNKKAEDINGFRAFGKWHFSVKPFFKSSFRGASCFGAPYSYAREVIKTSGKLDTNPGGKTAADGELITLALAELYPFSRHPYKVRDDEAMRDMAESAKQYGIRSQAQAGL